VISVILTAHNEGPELKRTIDSVQAETHRLAEIIIVDDGSTDGSCLRLEGSAVRIIRHNERLGVGASRNAGASAATGEVFAFIDGHQRFSPGCLDKCSEVALARKAITWPDVRGFDEETRLIHGASFRMSPELGRFTAAYRHARPLARVSRITALRAPGYVMPRSVYEEVKWPMQLRQWGASEAAVSLKAFFLGVPILHVCGPLTRHLFKKTFHYRVTSEDVDWNHAAIARICFDERTWYEYWLPSVFSVDSAAFEINNLERLSIRDEQREFQRGKVRSDREFWHGLLKMPEPRCLRNLSIGSHLRAFRLPLKRD